MRINEMNNLYCAYNSEENFRILICAFDEAEAAEIAFSYKADSHLVGDFSISHYEGEDVGFNCDYILV